MGSGDLGLAHRTLTAQSLEALVGYQFSDWTVGVDFDYRFHQQQTPAADVDNTNLKGRGWTLGLGAQYRATERWAFQAALDLLGHHRFDQQAASLLETTMKSPLGLRAKAQYLLGQTPWSVDASLGYQTWRSFRIGENAFDRSTNAWFAGIGVSFQLSRVRFADDSSPEAQPTPAPTSAVVSESPAEEKLPAFVTVEKTGTGTKLKFDESGFRAYQSEPTPELKQKIEQIAPTLAKPEVRSVRVKGYADASGSPDLNLKLSQERAERAKIALIKAGVEEKKVSAIGLGSENPIADNATEAGRAQNRRVEIEAERTDR